MINENSSRDEVLAALTEDGYALEFVSEDLKADKEVVLEAVREEGSAFQFALDDLRKDKEFVLEAVRQNGRALEFASEDLRVDKGFVLEAVKQTGWALRYASEDLREDKKVVLAAVFQHGLALRYALGDLRADKEVVLTAVKQHGRSLMFASGDLRHHPLLKSIAEETKRGKQQNISYKLFCFVEKNPELYKLCFLTSNEMRSVCNSQNAASSGNSHQFVFNFARHQLDSPQDENDSQRCKPKSTGFSLCVIS